MATNRVIPPGPEQLMPEKVPDPRVLEKEQKERERRKLSAVLRAGAIAQIIVGSTVVLAICYVAKLVLITLLVSVLLAFMLDPVVKSLERIRLPRPAGAFLAVLLMLAATYACSYFLYARGVSFIHELPKYSDKIRGLLSHVREQTTDLERTSQQVLPETPNKKAMP